VIESETEIEHVLFHLKAAPVSARPRVFPFGSEERRTIRGRAIPLIGPHVSLHK
jgi:hypothetical protein